MLDFGQLRQEIGNNIRILRKNVNLTQQELAEKVEKSRFWVTAIETGNNLPTVEGLYILAEVLNCTISDFLPSNIQKIEVSYFGPKEIIDCQSTKDKIISVLDGTYLI